MDIQRYGRCWLCRVGRSRVQKPGEWLPLLAWIDGRLVGIGSACSPGCEAGAHVLIRWTEEEMQRESEAA